MAPGLKQLFKRQAEPVPPEEEGVEDVEGEPATIATHIFGKHLHKVRLTTPTTTAETEGEMKDFPREA